MDRGPTRVSDAVTAYIGLGANLGDRLATLREAMGQLSDLGLVTGVSSLYETAPVGYEAQPAFLNAVVELQTALDAPELIEAMLSIETTLGRTRSFRNAPRTLDLDLLLLGDRVVATPNAQVPHPRLQERAFVLAPLVEVAPDAVHPVLHVTLRELYDALDSRSGVERIAVSSWVTLPASGAGTTAGRSGSPVSS